MGSINKIASTKYAKKPISKDWLRKNNFRYSHTERLNQEVSEDVYTYKFPILRNETGILLDCELTVYLSSLPTTSSDVIVDVYDHKTNNMYHPFYYYEYGDYEDLLSKINPKIEYELNRLGIKPKEKKKRKK